MLLSDINETETVSKYSLIFKSLTEKKHLFTYTQNYLIANFSTTVFKKFIIYSSLTRKVLFLGHGLIKMLHKQSMWCMHYPKIFTVNDLQKKPNFVEKMDLICFRP